jgi:hypothetical protein
MKISLKRLNSHGVAHHLLVAVIAVTFVAGFGAYKVFFSKAAISYETRSSIVYMSQADGKGCWLAGRNWDGNSCNKTCRAAGSNFVAATSTHLGYCTGAVAVDMTQARCNELGRRYVNSTGCSKRIDQDKTPAATQCIYSSNTYIANNGADHCAISCSGQWLNNKPECPVAPAPAPAPKPAPTPTPTPAPTSTTTSNTSAGAPTTGSASATTPVATTNTPGDPSVVIDDGTGDDVDTAGPVIQTASSATSGAVTIDGSISHPTCLQLLGREWVPAQKINGTATPAGCSTSVCHNSNLKVVQNANGAAYCQGYVAGTATTKAICDKLHRTWISEANRCAQHPDQKRVKANGAKQCQPPFTVYVFHTNVRDECLKPSTVEKLQRTLASVKGGTLDKIANVGPSAFCKSRGKLYVDGQCKSKPKEVKANVSVEPKGGNKAPNGKSWADFCKSLGRTASGKGCSAGCTQLNFARSAATAKDHHGYDKCVLQKSPTTTICDKNPDAAGCDTDDGITTKSVPCYEFRKISGQDKLCPLSQGGGTTCLAGQKKAVTFKKGDTVYTTTVCS